MKILFVIAGIAMLVSCTTGSELLNPHREKAVDHRIENSQPISQSGLRF